MKSSCLYRSCTRRVAAKLGNDAGWGLIVQFILLWFFRKKKRKWAQRFELLTLAISVPDALSVIAVSTSATHNLFGCFWHILAVTQALVEKVPGLLSPNTGAPFNTNF